MPSSISLPPGSILQGTIRLPGDKSITHRLIMLCALAEGESRITHYLRAEDCMSTVTAMRALGVTITEPDGETLVIKGVGLRGLKKPSATIDLGNSGTTARLLLGLLSAQPFDVTLTGDDSLRKRPMRRVVDPLRTMGARIEGDGNGNFLPLRIRGGALNAIAYDNALGSAQVKSAILLAGLYAKGETAVTEPYPSRDHTERLLKVMGAGITVKENSVRVSAVNKLKPIAMNVPGDLSSASFWMAAAALQPGKTIRIEQVGLNQTRLGFVKELIKMGAKVHIEPKDNSVEPYGNITVQGEDLKSISLDRVDIPSIIDELPLIMVLASVARGRTTIRGAEELRAKETDRISAMAKNLSILGVDVEEKQDGIEIKGGNGFSGGSVDSFGDHRIAMAMAVASVRAGEAVEIIGKDCVGISYPEFFEVFRSLGSAS